MKKALLIILCLGLAQTVLAQAGLGLGSNGLNFKSSAQAKNALVVRGNILVFDDGPQGFIEAGWLHRFLQEEKARLYLGASLGTGFGENSGGFQRLMLPFGVEYFPFTTRTVGLNFEGGPQFLLVSETFGVGLAWQIEFTYYFKRKQK
jgi:hypothetical protein